MNKDPFGYFWRYHNSMKPLIDQHRKMQSLTAPITESLDALRILANNTQWNNSTDGLFSSIPLLNEHWTTIEQLGINQDYFNRLAPINSLVRRLIETNSDLMIGAVPPSIFINLGDVTSRLDDILSIKDSNDSKKTTKDHQDAESFTKKVNWLQLIQLIISIWLAYTGHVGHQEHMIELKKQTEIKEKTISIQEQQLEIDKQKLQLEKDRLEKQTQFEELFIDFVESIIPLIPMDRDEPESNLFSDQDIE